MGGRFENFTPPTLGSELTSGEITLLEELSALANSSSLEFLRKTGGSIINVSLSEFLALTNLSDVLISSPTSGQVLVYNGSVWVNSTEAGLGDVTGPASSIDNAIVRFDGITGKLIQGYISGAPTISDLGVITATNPIFITPNLGTPSVLVLTNATGLPAASVLAGTFGTGAYVMDTTLTVPKIIGSTSTTGDLTLQTTSGVGASGADMHFLVGNNGATEAMTILNNGNVGIGTTSPLGKLHVIGTTPIILEVSTTEGIYLSGDTLNGGYSANGDYSLGINWTGYQNGATQYRDFVIYNGINQHIATFDGNTRNVGIGTTTPSSKLDVTTTALGTTQTTTSGLALVNTTAAALDTQQISPALRWSGFGWKTDATAASQAVDFRSYVVPVQGAANPTGYLTFESSVNGAAYGNLMTLTSAGNLGIGTTSPNSKLYVLNSDVVTSAVTSGLQYLRMKNSNSGGTYTGGIEFYTHDDRRNAGIYAERNNVDGTSGELSFVISSASNVLAEALRINKSGNVGIGTTGPTNLLSLGGNAARIFWMERHTTADTAGNTLTITAGGATAAATDKAGGALILQGGLSTGSAESGVTIQGCVAGASGTADRTQTTAIEVLGNKIGFFAVTPVTRQTELTDELTTVTFTAPGTPDYAIQDLVQNTGFGFVTKDEGNTVLSVIANLQARVNELETKLTAYGLLIDAD